MPSLPTVFLLSGLLCDETIWQPQIAGLSHLARLEVPDYRDCRSLAAMAQTVLARAPERFAVAGHSMGGRVAMQVLAELERRGESGRLAGIALLDTAAGGPAPNEAAKRRPLVERAYAEGMQALVEAWLPPMVHPDRLADRGLMAPLEEMIRRTTPRQFEGQVEALLGRPDVRPLLPRIACPAMVLCGREDAWRTVEEHEAMARLIPGVQFDVVPRCGHMATVERPEAVNAALARWIGGITGPSPTPVKNS